MSIKIDKNGKWQLHLDQRDGDSGLEMLGTVTAEGITGALGYHRMMNKYWMGVRVGERTHWHSLPTGMVMAQLTAATSDVMDSQESKRAA